MMFDTRRAVALILFGIMSNSALCFAQNSSTNFPRFLQAQGELDVDGLPVSGARICLVQNKNVCFQMPPHVSGSVTYQFGLEPRSERLTLKRGGSWVFFSAAFSGGGSGMLESIAVLRYEPDGSIRNLMPYVVATNVSQRAMWDLPDFSPYPILVHADFLWGKDETHFSDHLYTVEAWVFDSGKDQYTRAFRYNTSQRYSGGDSEDTPISVLQGERKEIVRRLKTQ